MAHFGLEDEQAERRYSRRGRQTSAQIVEWLLPWIVILAIVVFALWSAGVAGVGR